VSRDDHNFPLPFAGLYKTRKKKVSPAKAEKLAPEKMINIGARVRDRVIRGFFRTVKESAMGVASG